MVYYNVLTPTGIGSILMNLGLTLLKRYHFAQRHEYVFIRQGF